MTPLSVSWMRSVFAFFVVFFLSLGSQPQHAWAVAASRSGSSSPGRLYDVLGVNSDADENTIKKAHRRLAMKWHPDRNPKNKEAASAKFKEAQEAYEVLSDPSKRQVYDMYGEEGLKAQAQGMPPGYQSQHGHGFDSGGFSGSPFGSNDMAEMLAEMFGGGGRRQPRGFSSFGGDPYGGGEGPHGFASFFSQMFGAEDPFSGGQGGGSMPFGSSGFGGGGPQQTSPAAAAEYTFEVTLEDLFTGASKVVVVPHRIRQRGQPFTYIYKHSYTIKLKSWWKDGTALKYPPLEVNLAQIGPTVVPPVTLRLRILRHRFFERIGDDLMCVVKISPADATRKLKLKLPLLDGSFLSFETVGKLFHGATQSFPGRGMPTSKGDRGTLYVQFKFNDKVDEDERARARQRQQGGYWGGGGW